MSLGPVDTEDKRKIHAEVNQIVNQRLLLTTLAITVFGVMTRLLIPNTSPIPGSGVERFIYIGSVLLTIILFALFLLAHQLTYMLRVFTSYLVETGASNWEKDWGSYRSKFRYLGYTKPQAMIFLLLGTLSAGFPFMLWVGYSLALGSKAYAIVCAAVGVLYVILVFGMGMRGWYAKEDKVRLKWSALNKA